MAYEGIRIQHALSPGGEYRVTGIGKVDGYCHETNTVYEYYGDFWHGNPCKFDPKNYNPISGKRYGDLYQATITRDHKIKAMGYNLAIKWESECTGYPY